MNENTTKSKLLLVGWGYALRDTMLANALKQLAEEYEIKFAPDINDALEIIARTKLLENEEILGIVFQTNMWLVHSEDCKTVFSFAKRFATKHVIAIKMNFLYPKVSFVAEEVIKYSVKEEDWNQVKTILESGYNM
jgi:hypothetical protein